MLPEPLPIPSDAAQRPVTVLGQGAMGVALAAVLARNGHPVTVWNRTPGRAAPGTREARTAAEAVSASPLVLISLLDPPAVRDVLARAGGAVEGRTLVDLTSAPPEHARATAAWAAERGARHLAGGVMADPEDVGTTRSRLLVSGDPEAHDAHAGVLCELLATEYAGPDPGAAALRFLALVSIGYDAWLAFLDTLALLRADGLDPAPVVRATREMFADMGDLLERWAQAAEDGVHPPAAGPLRVHAPLVDDVVRAREQRGIDTTQPRRLQHLIGVATARGHAEDGFSALIEVLAPVGATR